MEVPTLDPDRLVDVFRALGDSTRLRLLGLIAERPRSATELAEAVAVGAPTVSHHLDKLARARLVTVERAGQRRIYSLNSDTLAAFSRIARPESPGAERNEEAGSEPRARIIRDFFDGDRLKQIPAQRKKRVIVLQHLLERFAPGSDYRESEVNAILKTAHEDFATLRRELIDYGFMTREGGVYRVAQSLPSRSVQVNQEITGDETAWLRQLLASTVSN
jgi:hypothetical protein